MDLTYHEPGFIKKMTPGLYETYVNLGIDPEKELIEVAPTVHFFMGGLNIDTQWQTEVAGLFGAGEVTGGMHGANRLSQNALAEILVSGYMAGRNAAIYSKENKDVHLNPKLIDHEVNMIQEIMDQKEGLPPSQVRKELRDVMNTNVGVYRTEESLMEGLRKIESLEKTKVRITSKLKYMNRELLEAIENKNMFTTAKTVILSALERKESRGAHFRSDYPETDNENYLVNIIVRKNKDEFIIDKEPVSLEVLGLEVE